MRSEGSVLHPGVDTSGHVHDHQQTLRGRGGRGKQHRTGCLGENKAAATPPGDVRGAHAVPSGSVQGEQRRPWFANAYEQQTTQSCSLQGQAPFTRVPLTAKRRSSGATVQHRGGSGCFPPRNGGSQVSWAESTAPPKESRGGSSQPTRGLSGYVTVLPGMRICTKRGKSPVCFHSLGVRKKK